MGNRSGKPGRWRPGVTREANCGAYRASDRRWRTRVARKPAGVALRGGRGQAAGRAAAAGDRLGPARRRPRRTPPFLAVPAPDLEGRRLGAAHLRVRRRAGRDARRPAGRAARGARRDRRGTGRHRQPAGGPAHSWNRPPPAGGPDVPSVGGAVLPGPRQVPGARRPAVGADGRAGSRAAFLAAAPARRHPGHPGGLAAGFLAAAWVLLGTRQQAYGSRKGAFMERPRTVNWGCAVGPRMPPGVRRSTLTSGSSLGVTVWYLSDWFYVVLTIVVFAFLYLILKGIESFER